ncbi:MAG: hypothetical protein HON53_06490 [Planctomycetaceae bacterium]|jgi:hypothetical protein|nr:hypothetical protein [Planctomycetaceae bacterium]MBT6153232.1 hypothetical protein [Planctomycetaceae bacterium]MBT6486889.1 hypothetical protein [Planctomycetaceae bacterium]
MSASNDEELDKTGSPPISFVKWLSLSFVLTAMLAFAAAHAPGQAGIACRFALLFGLVVGALSGWLAGQGRDANHWRRLLFVGVLGATGFAGLTLESYRLYVVHLKDSIGSGVGLNLLPPKILDEMNEGRAEVLATRSRFDVYLRYRIMENQLVGDKAYPGPTAAYFWAVEIFLAAIAAAGTFHIFTRPPTQGSSSSS